MRPSRIHLRCAANWLPPLLLGLTVAALYWPFLKNPFVFDDLNYFDGTTHADDFGSFLDFHLRWLPYASFQWTLTHFGQNLVPLRLGNLALHCANCMLLFLFLRRLYFRVLPAGGPLSPSTLALASALLFGLNPVAVYAVAYLSQRSILLATLFGLLSWCLFLEGLSRQRQSWLLASAIAFLLAGFSKEHALMVPAVAVALLFLMEKPTSRWIARYWPTCLLYALFALFIIWSAKSGRFAGRAYEPNASSYLVQESIDPNLAYPLSVLNQAAIYFKYFWLWIVPNPAWMSVDMIESFAPRFWAWPQTAGLVAFVLYPVFAVRWLLQRGPKGLLGFALLCPWLQFLLGLGTVYLQEIFVLYRSYLWMPGAFAALPYLLQKLSTRQALASLALVFLAIIPLSWNRLQTFSEPLRLWNDAALLVEGRNKSPRIGRIYHNRGVAYLNLKRYPEAIRDFDSALEFLPLHSRIYNDRGVAQYWMKNFPQALHDFSRAIELDPDYFNPWLGRAATYEVLNNLPQARLDYARSCTLGIAAACGKP